MEMLNYKSNTLIIHKFSLHTLGTTSGRAPLQDGHSQVEGLILFYSQDQVEQFHLLNKENLCNCIGGMH